MLHLNPGSILSCMYRHSYRDFITDTGSAAGAGPCREPTVVSSCALASCSCSCRSLVLVVCLLARLLAISMRDPTLFSRQPPAIIFSHTIHTKTRPLAGAQ